MKNKRFLLKMLLVSVVAIIVMFLSPKSVKAYFDSSDVNTRLILKTTINNYSNQGDLRYVVTEDNSGQITFSAPNGNGSVTLDYTKSIYLSSNATFDENSSDTVQLYETSDFDITDSSFFNGTTVYLYEVYDFDISSGLAINADAFTANFSNGDYVYVNISNTSVVNNSMSEYSYSSTNQCRPTMYLEGVYDDEDLDDRTGTYYNSICYSEGGSKTAIIEKGTINMPRFFWKFYGTASGNLLPAGGFYIGDSEATVNDSSMWNECKYSAFVNFANATISYVGSDDNYVDSDGSHTYTKTSNGYGISDSTDLSSYLSDGEYKISRSMDANLNKDNPTGVFFDVMPFVVAIVIAGAGVILLKKNSVK